MAKFNWDRTSKENLDFRHRALGGDFDQGDKDEHLHILKAYKEITLSKNVSNHPPSQSAKQAPSKKQSKSKVKENVRRFTLVVEGYGNSTITVSCEKKVGHRNLNNDWIIESIKQLSKFIAYNSDFLEQFLTGFVQSHYEKSLSNHSNLIVDVKTVLEVSRELTPTVSQTAQIESESDAQLQAKRDAKRWANFVKQLRRRAGLSNSAQVIQDRDKLTLAKLLLWADGKCKVMGKTFDSIPEESRKKIHGFIKKLSKPV